MANTCAKCQVDYPSLRAFDAHPCMTASLDPASPDVLRERRRTSTVTIGPDTVHLCDPDCRNEVLADLGIPSAGNGNYRRRGEAAVHITWSGRDYRVTWEPRTSNMRSCDMCGGQWRYRIPSLVAKARAQGAAQKGRPPAIQAPFRKSEAA